jgi:hypothetical protein
VSKYTTEELVQYLERRGRDEEVFVIIAKLVAADALCKAAIDAMGGIGLRDDPAFAKLNKAIDDYEEVGS